MPEWYHLYRHMRNLYRFLEFAESPTKFSGESPKVQNKNQICKINPTAPPLLHM